jgi:hypothetical protein
MAGGASIKGGWLDRNVCFNLINFNKIQVKLNFIQLY